VEPGAFLAQTDHPLRALAQAICDVIAAAEPGLQAHVKWNAPSFVAGGDDRITLNLSRPDRVMVVFHRGAKVKDSKTGARLLADDSGMLVWATDQRASVHFADAAALDLRRDWLRDFVRRWIATVVS